MIQMSKVSFEWVMEHDKNDFIVGPDSTHENRGYFTNMRIDRDTLSEGWYAYDIRHGDSGNFCTIEAHVGVNHAGTFLTQKPLELNENGYLSLCGENSYTFV